MRSVSFVLVLGMWLSSRLRARCLSSHLRGRCLSSRHEVGAFRPVFVQRHFLIVRPGIRSVFCLLATSMNPAYRIRHFNPTLLVSSSGCFSPYFPVLASRGLSNHSVLSFRNQDPRLGSICGETEKVEDREPIVHTPPHLLQHPKGICEKERLWLAEHRKRLRKYDTTRLRGSTQLRGSTLCPGKSECDQKM
jgi:hypothetical protein